MSSIVVVGGGQASASFVIKLLKLGYTGHITLICGEGILPYQRPPLSKKYLLDQMNLEQLYIRQKSFYLEAKVELVLGKKVLKINRENKSIELECGQHISYSKLILSTGSESISLPSNITHELKGVYQVRSLADVGALKPEFVSGKNLLVIGGGFVGLEIAAVARKLGLNVAIVEKMDRILQRVSAVSTAQYFINLHLKHKVSLTQGMGVEELLGSSGFVRGVKLSNGREVPADLVIIGIGAYPNTRLAEEANLDVENGIKVDEFCYTSDPDILAAGDCTSFPYLGKQIRLESVGNAIEQAEVAANSVFGNKIKYEVKPWFWSDQYDTKLQIAGLNSGYDKVVERNSNTGHSYWYYQGDKFLAVDAVNDPRAYMVGKKLLNLGISPKINVISNSEFDLMALLKV